MAAVPADTSLGASAVTPLPPFPPAGLNDAGGGHRFLPSVKVPMRDGVRLSADIYLPDGPGPFPLILIRTPYDKNEFRPNWVTQSTSALVNSCTVQRTSSGAGPVDVYVSAGYGVVAQDFRGTWESEGVFRSGKWERCDFEDTAKWLDAQPWSARSMGMWGCSYLGHVQVVGGVTGTPSLKAITPMSAGGSFSSGVGRCTMLWNYTGGAREYSSMLTSFARWQGAEPKVDIDNLMSDLPIAGILERAGLPPTDFDNAMSHPPESSYWYEDSELVTEQDQLYTPALWIYNWNDIQPGEAIDAFQFGRTNAANATVRDNQFLIIGPGRHCSFDTFTESFQFGDLELGDTRFDLWGAMVKWNDRWVKGELGAIDDMPRVTYWLYGKNEWRTAKDMPLPGTEYWNLYISSRQGANSLNGDGQLSFNPPDTSSTDAYRYDPHDPTPTGQMRSWTVEMTDQRFVEARQDVLVYTSEVLQQGLAVVGPIKMVLHVSSSAVDTDFTGKLVDVYPDGRAIQLQTGILRARYRDGFKDPQLLNPGQIYEITVDLNATANWFAPGHRIRLEVSSSNFPRFDRNMNTGGDGFSETRGVVAKNTVFSGPNTLSRLVLPVVPV
ncbi:CocE/NonD family hydrolase [Mesorhizobium sp. M0751]|uniref:CocE/NonD family hydrolase n=1 Tax=unclassified Mesorhizobium TaxID=325217 RepID=UPI003337DD56